MADVRTQSMEDVDSILRIYHTAIVNDDLKIGQSAVLDKLLEQVSLLELVGRERADRWAASPFKRCLSGSCERGSLSHVTLTLVLDS